MGKHIGNLSIRRRINYFKRRKEVLEYLKECKIKRHFPSYKELNEKFKISSYKLRSEELYKKSGLPLLRIPKKPQNSLLIIRKELIKYLKKCVQNNHYPSRREIERNFHLRLNYGLFKNIRDLYNKAGIPYKQINSQEIKKKKAEVLLKIVLPLLPKWNLVPIKVCETTERGVDIVTKTRKGNKIGIELKAYNKNEMVKKRNFEQIERWLKTGKFHKILFIKELKISSRPRVPSFRGPSLISYKLV